MSHRIDDFDSNVEDEVSAFKDSEKEPDSYTSDYDRDDYFCRRTKIMKALGWKNLNVEPLKQEAMLSKRLFVGYTATYHYVSHSASEFSIAKYSVPYLTNLSNPPQESWSEVRLAHTGSQFWEMRVTETPQPEDYFDDITPDVVLVEPACANIYGPVIPIFFTHADVLPSIVKADNIRCIVSAVAQSIHLYDEDEFLSKDSADQMALGAPLTYELSGLGKPQRIVLHAKISSITKLPSDKRFHDRILLELDTFYGLLTVACQQSKIAEKDKVFLEEGNYATIVGWLFGDCATGDYQEGAIYDIDHLYQLLFDSLTKKRIERLYSLLDSFSSYISEGKNESIGRESILQHLNKEIFEKIASVHYVNTLAHSEKAIQPQMDKAILIQDKDGNESCLWIESTDGKFIRRLHWVTNLRHYTFHFALSHSEWVEYSSQSVDRYYFSC